ncbi:MAG: zf-HC2 domain-containing protein [Spirochaetota bacterium]|jgi:anti-sigma factor RsiW|nr:zf-HC2 domain-containing protein [Spirochaetota bacterium]
MKHISDRQLSACIDNDLTEAEQQFVRAHAAECAVCKSRLDAYLAAQTMLRRLPQVKVDEEFALTRIRARIASEERIEEQEGIFHAWRRFMYPLAGVATTAAVTLALFFSLSYSGEQALLSGKTTLAQGPMDSCVAEQETDEIIRGYQDMQQLYYY